MTGAPSGAAMSIASWKCEKKRPRYASAGSIASVVGPKGCVIGPGTGSDHELAPLADGGVAEATSCASEISTAVASFASAARTAACAER